MSEGEEIISRDCCREAYANPNPKCTLRWIFPWTVFWDYMKLRVYDPILVICDKFTKQVNNYS